MGIHPKIGITGLPRSGKSAVLDKVIEMIIADRKKECMVRGEDINELNILGGVRTQPLHDGADRLGYEVINHQTGEKAVFAHKNIDTRLQVLGMGVDIEALNSISVPAIEQARDEYEIIMVDEIGKFSVESEEFVKAVRSALDVDKPSLLTLHKKSRHPLLQDIRRRDDARILEVTPVNRALLPYKVHKLLGELYY